jgi:hypothetical protein
LQLFSRPVQVGLTLIWLGLLSGHLLIKYSELPELDIFKQSYDDCLLTLAVDLAQRILPAFETPTKIPYGTVNLMIGIPPNETDISCTACATTFLLEFGVLSRLTGDMRFEVRIWRDSSLTGEVFPKHH